MRTPVGGYVLSAAPVEINAGRPRRALAVRNTGDRPIQVGSHFHFFEANRALAFDREQAFGQRLDIPAGTAVRFEPGDEREVTLVPFGGKQQIHGFNNLVDGWAPLGGAYRPRATQAIRLAGEYGFMSDGPGAPRKPPAPRRPAGEARPAGARAAGARAARARAAGARRDG